MADFVLTEGKVLRLLVYDSNKSVEEVARSLGVSRQYVNQMFHMNSIPPKHRGALANLLEVQEDVFDQMTLVDQVDELRHHLKVLRAENEYLKAKVSEHEARIRSLEAENNWLKTKYN